LTDGAAVSAADYLAALDVGHAMRRGLAPIFARFDAILCPAALGTAPEGLEFTGDSIFNGLWTFAGTPAVTIPAFTANNSLPMGAQLVGARGDDARLLRTADWLARRISLFAD
jgi:Asp-tRNA(Asn)/Glu-tRNA(Gln) amidotransferase A subunit family amidase